MTFEAEKRLLTAGGIEIVRETHQIDYETGTQEWTTRLDSERGAVFSSNYEYPGRYTRWDTAIVNPPLVITSRDCEVKISAQNERGQVILSLIRDAISQLEIIEKISNESDKITLTVEKPSRLFREEERSKQPSVFSVIRALIELFSCDDEHLGLFGAFGYDLAFQFEPIKKKLERPADQRDMVLYLPDEILVVDHHARKSTVFSYGFYADGESTLELSNESAPAHFVPANHDPGRGDHEPGEYAKLVVKAIDYFRRGDLFEVVPGQTFTERCGAKPSQVSQMLREINPSPYSFFINLGDNEFLVGASPEMYVRVSGGRRVETCPISGTIQRGRNAIEDEAQIRKLLNSTKDEAELTMCTDVDRNDKSRISEPGSVRVIGRRQIEMYSRLIHTVDHVEAILREDMDALDAFLSHAWAVTVTGAPKRWAMQFIEDNEKTSRAWYGGAIGMIHFTGDLNTGLTLRTVRIKNGIAEVRAGATLLFDSDPAEEEAETELKASAMLTAIRDADKVEADLSKPTGKQIGAGHKILLIDHEDSFVHTLADYFRQTGAEVVTYRTPVENSVIEDYQPDLVVLSPGPGCPADFNCSEIIAEIVNRKIPIFGVCLGMQALCEFYGGTLEQLDSPMHGKSTQVPFEKESKLFGKLESPITVGRYHSLYASPNQIPKEFKVIAQTEDGVPMAIEHCSSPIAAVQFHPESIMSLDQEAGHQIIVNVLQKLVNLN